MSIVTYIGLNFEVEVSDEITDAPIEIGYGLSEEENRLSVKEKHFKTQFVYEVLDSEYQIWEMNEYNSQFSPHNFEKAKNTFVQLCKFLNELIPKGDFCEIFICWLEDENEPIEFKVFIDLNNPASEPLEHYEKCYIKLFK
ncbi:MAG: hypothetical protein ABS935_01885 [Solibacillus sp.]|uniref:hypothetical protein n=1 Tax=Solibacillus sp. TaxID=1909654 RepID=UPI00331625F5